MRVHVLTGDDDLAIRARRAELLTGHRVAPAAVGSFDLAGDGRKLMAAVADVPLPLRLDELSYRLPLDGERIAAALRTAEVPGQISRMCRVLAGGSDGSPQLSHRRRGDELGTVPEAVRTALVSFPGAHVRPPQRWPASFDY